MFIYFAVYPADDLFLTYVLFKLIKPIIYRVFREEHDQILH